MKVSRLLKKSREARGLTQRDISDALHFKTAQFVSNWEREISYLADESLPKLAELLKVPLKRLVTLIYAEKLQKLKDKQSKLLKRFGV